MFALQLVIVCLAIIFFQNAKGIVDPNEVTFYLYTPESPDDCVTLVPGQLENITLITTRPLIVISHGYRDNSNKTWIINLKNTYLQKGEYNIITVDWAKPADQIYSISALNTKDVGKYTALFLNELKNVKGISYDIMHLVGHSLGAQVSGFCGKYLVTTENITVGRISGLDPAGDLFDGNPPSERLAPGDAKFVDVVHTDGNQYGYYNVCGDIDFYPNGGIAPQPACGNNIQYLCSHVSAYVYFTESINTFGFVSSKCDTYDNYLQGLCNNNEQAIMGENVNQTQTGVFYLTTNVDPPYAKYGKI